MRVRGGDNSPMKPGKPIWLSEKSNNHEMKLAP